MLVTTNNHQFHIVNDILKVWWWFLVWKIAFKLPNTVEPSKMLHVWDDGTWLDQIWTSHGMYGGSRAIIHMSKNMILQRVFWAKTLILIVFLQFDEILSFLRCAQCDWSGIKTTDDMMKVITEYDIRSCMWYVSLTRYLQVALFLLYALLKIVESALFCVMFCCFPIVFVNTRVPRNHHSTSIAIDHTIY